MRSNNKKANIICLSNQLWDYPLWTNKRHVMTLLAQQGYNVLFVDPPINVGRLFLRHVLAGKWPLGRLLTGTYEDEGATIFSPLNISSSETHLAKKINKLAAKKFDPDLKTILWVYHLELPQLFETLKVVKHDLLVYDCVDNYSGFPKYNTWQKKEQINKQEELLAKRADIVFASAPGLVDKLVRYNPKTFYTPNVGDFEAFSKARAVSEEIPEELTSLPRPRIGFAGAVDDYKFDRALMKKIALDHPSYSFIVIGPLGLKDKETTKKALGMEKIDNIYFLGSRPYKTMPKYFSGFDAFIIPYQLNDYTVGGCFPVKFHEALASGLPVIVTDLPSYQAFEAVCYISKSYNTFSQNVRRALEEDSDLNRKKRQEVAKENTWEKKVARMLSLIDSEVNSL